MLSPQKAVIRTLQGVNTPVYNWLNEPLMSDWITWRWRLMSLWILGRGKTCFKNLNVILEFCCLHAKLLEASLIKKKKNSYLVYSGVYCWSEIGWFDLSDTEWEEEPTSPQENTSAVREFGSVPFSAALSSQSTWMLASFSSILNPILPLLYLNAVHLLCGAVNSNMSCTFLNCLNFLYFVFIATASSSTISF